MSPSVSIIIPTRDNLAMISQVMRGILALTPEPFEVLIVDNASQDPEVLLFFESFADAPHVRVLRMKENKYYWPAINAGIRAAHPEVKYVMALNDDIVIQSERWLARLIEAFGEDSKVAYVGDFQSSRFFPPLYGFTDGYCAMFRRSLFEKIGLFDERWPFYWGFVDFQLRAYRHGFRSNDIKKAGDITDRIEGVVYHLRGRTLETMRAAFDQAKNVEIFGSTWTPVELLANNGFYRQALTVGAATLLRRSWSGLKQALAALERAAAPAAKDSQ